MEVEEKSLTLEGEPMARQGKVAIQALPLNKIKLGRNSRLSVSKEELSGLMQSIKEVGLLQPIGVVKSETGYEVAYGNRRFMACSKLGLSKIPVIIHESKNATDVDLKNLTENIQRRNLGLSEVGRYIVALKKEKLTSDEIAVRLGVSKSYVASCLNAFNEVPDKYKADLELSITQKGRSHKRPIGKISVSSATAIINASKSYRLDEKQTEKLFEAAKTDDRFLSENTRKYAAAVKNGAKDPVGAVKPLNHACCQFWITKEHRNELQKKYVDDGPFRSLNGLFTAILAGKKSVKIEIVDLK